MTEKPTLLSLNALGKCCFDLLTAEKTMFDIETKIPLLKNVTLISHPLKKKKIYLFIWLLWILVAALGIFAMTGRVS